MNDGQASLMAEMKKSREENAGMHAIVMSKLSDLSAPNEYCAMKSEMKQMREQNEEVCEKLRATEQELASQRKTQLEMQKKYEKVSEELAELKIEQEDQKTNQRNNLQPIQMGISEMKKTVSDYLNLSNSENDTSELRKELSEMRSEMKQFKEQQMKQEEAHKETKKELEKRCAKLEATEQDRQLEVKQLKEELANQQKSQLEMQKELEDQKNTNKEMCAKLEAAEKVCDKLMAHLEVNRKTKEAELKRNQNNEAKLQQALNEIQSLRLEVAKMQKEGSENQKLSSAMRSEMKKSNELQEKLKHALEDRSAEIKKVCDELAAQKAAEIRDVIMIFGELARIRKKLEAQDLKLQNHDDSISICKKIPVQELVVGKWKMVSSTCLEEYEKHRLTYAPYSGDRAKIDFENREFTYDNRILRSYVDNNTEDPSFKSDYSVNGRIIVYGHKEKYSNSMNQLINVYIKKQQLVVLAGIFKDSKEVAACECYYDRV